MESRQKVNSIFSYLLDAKRINEQVIRNVNDYKKADEKVFWLSELPKNIEGCVINKEDNEKPWLEIEKQKIDDPPEPSYELVPYITTDYINPTKKQMYVDKVTVEDEEIKFEEDETLMNLWNQWIVEWEEWSTENAPKYKVQNFYNQLFKLYQNLERNREQLEIVYSNGLIVWRKGNEKIFHPAFIRKMELSFDAKKGKFSFESINDETSLELNMLDNLDIPNKDKLEEIKNQVKGKYINPRKIEEIEEHLNQIANYISSKMDSKGVVVKNIENPNSIKYSDIPVFYDMPCIIVRRNNERFWIADLENIIDNIEGDYKIPETIQSLVEKDSVSQSEESLREWKSVGEDLLFPLEANEDQKEIARRLSKNYGVVVQGPPGTGKSHTIVNLISHLLAHGKRVLVTSQKEKALSVLKNKIPEEIRALCISVLGSDKKSLSDLDESVRKITDNLASDSNNLEKEIEELEVDLDKCRRNQAKLHNQLREKEIRLNQNILYNNEEYTLIDSAKWIKENENEFSWIKDEIDMNTNSPIREEEFNKMLYIIGNTNKEDIKILNEIENIIDKVPSYEEIVKKMTRLKQIEDNEKMYLSRIENWKISNNNSFDYGNALKKSERIIKKLEEIECSWINNIKETYYSSDLGKSIVDNLIIKAKDNIKAIEINMKSLIGNSIKIPKEVNINQLSNDFKPVYQTLKEKGKIGPLFSVFKPKSKYILKECFFNDENISTKEHAEMINNYIENKKTEISLKNLWNDSIKEYGGAVINEINLNSLSKMQNNLSVIEDIVNWDETYKKQIINSIGRIYLPDNTNWYSLESYKEIKKGIESILILNEYEELKKYFSLINEFIEGKESLNILKSSIESCDFNELRKSIQEVKRLKTIRPEFDELNYIIRKLQQTIPQFVTELNNNDNVNLFEKYRGWNNAWRWSQWNTLLNELSKENIKEIEGKKEEEKKRERELIKKLVSKKTWYEQIKRTKESEKKSLYSWLEAIKKIGKGTGKHANYYRKIAQKEMENCKSAIPVWIMPLNKVIESLKLSNDLFDVVIFDESSQSDIFAIATLFRAKKAVIVGDDKQISPQAVGIDQEKIIDLINTHLNKIPQYQWFDLRTSLYSTALRVFPNKLMLKEHFRCVPEIIQYSNDLSYGGEIIPLRYPEKEETFDKPVIAVKVEDGYRHETRKENVPEIEKIVDTIINCCKDEKYKGMTMGVISLLGDAQAKLIENMLREKLGEQEMVERKLVCGDSYSFQGDERDIIFLSMVIASNVRFAAMTSEDAKRRFNVAASRAKNQMWLFHSVNLNDLNPNCVRYSLLSYCLDPGRINRELQENEDIFDSNFEKDVYKLIRVRNYAVTPQVKIGGGRYRIDLVVEGLKNRLAVECDGDKWHGIDKWEEDRERQLNLERVGWTFCRIRGSEFYRDPEKAMEKVWSKIEEMKIEKAIN